MAEERSYTDPERLLKAREELVEKVAQAIYAKNPAKQPWDGDTFGYKSDHWAAKDAQKLARKQARAVLDAAFAQELLPMAVELAVRKRMEAVWDEGFMAGLRPYGPNREDNPYSL